MRVQAADGSDGEMRAQGANHPGPRAVASPGVFYPRLCVCPREVAGKKCGSSNTEILGTTGSGNRRMRCRACGHRFKAAEP